MRLKLLPVLLLLCCGHCLAQDVQLSEDLQLGQILTDADGNTLYYFTLDANLNASACTGGCLSAWPAFYAEGLIAGEGLEEADFSSFQREDGAMQSTYKGWPLYYFASDAAPGDTNGEGVNNVWYVAKPDYSIMLMNNQLVGLDGEMYNSDYEPGEEMVQYFTDAEGRTLYYFVNDNFEQNNFTNEDFSNNAAWPIYEEAFQQVPSTLDASDFSVINVFDRQQLAYRGWPLYYFGQDAERGQTKGVSVPSPGVWPVAAEDAESAPVTSVKEIAALQHLKAAPNPFSEQIALSFELEETKRLQILVINGFGQTVWKQQLSTFNSGNHRLNLNHLAKLPNGWYQIRLIDASGQQTDLPIVKQ